jgi:hypothetical protein
VRMVGGDSLLAVVSVTCVLAGGIGSSLPTTISKRVAAVDRQVQLHCP